MENSVITMFTTTVRFCGEAIFVQPVCDFFQINYRNQTRAILRDKILQTCSTKKYDMLLFGDKRERLVLSKKGFIRWIQLINEQIVNKSLREKFVEFQTMVFDFLFGTIEREESAKITYKRLNKLKRLRSVIASEIYKCEQSIHNYLDGRLIQSQLNFNQESIESK